MSAEGAVFLTNFSAKLTQTNPYSISAHAIREIAKSQQRATKKVPQFFTPYFSFFSVRPENVRIMSKREPLSTGKDYLLECRSYGSRPPATVTWWKNSKFMNKAESQVWYNQSYIFIRLKNCPNRQKYGFYWSNGVIGSIQQVINYIFGSFLKFLFGE